MIQGKWCQNIDFLTKIFYLFFANENNGLYAHPAFYVPPPVDCSLNNIPVNCIKVLVHKPIAPLILLEELIAVGF